MAKRKRESDNEDALCPAKFSKLVTPKVKVQYLCIVVSREMNEPGYHLRTLMAKSAMVRVLCYEGMQKKLGVPHVNNRLHTPPPGYLFRTTDHDDDRDSGIVIVWASDANINTVLTLPAVAHIAALHWGESLFICIHSENS